MTYRQVYASISSPNVSITPTMYNAAFRKLGMDRTYVSFATTDLAGAISAMRVLGILGFSVSRPFKIEIVPLLDQVDPVARLIGAINVVTNTSGFLTGYNSDWLGAVRALTPHVNLDGKHAVVLGAGGAGRAIVYGLLTKGASLTIHARRLVAARAVATDLGVGFGDLDDPVTDADIVVNATPLGGWLEPEWPHLPRFRSGQVVLDVVFTPQTTLFMQRAREAGCTVVSGIEMLVQQAAVAFEHFTGEPAPAETMRAALLP